MFSTKPSRPFGNNPGKSDHNIDPKHRGQTKVALSSVFAEHGFRDTTPVRIKPPQSSATLEKSKFGMIPDDFIYQGVAARSGQRGLVVVFCAPQ